jgi:hypothetical protein
MEIKKKMKFYFAEILLFSEKYALPMAPLWSVQFGPGQRRVVVDEIVMHEKFAGYNHDIGAYTFMQSSFAFASKLLFFSFNFTVTF